MSPGEPAQTPATFEHFGALLRFLRQRAGLTRHQLASAVGLSERSISRFEQGRRPPDQAVLRARFMPALGLQPESALAERLLALATAARGFASHSPRTRDADRLGAGMPAGLLSTKIFPPRARADLVPRPRLLAALASVPLMPLTLVAAPAGFGKTTLLASWLQQRGGAAAGSGRQPAAWLALDEDDNDPASFLRYLVAALRTVAPGVGEATLALIRAPLPPRPDLLAPLINDLAGIRADHVLVLDDYHLITEPAVHQLISFLLEHLPPTLHLVIATREDPPLPLARMRARHQLLEIRAADLRFTTQEAALFLGTVMQLRLTPEELAAIEAHTEGWAAGLQLVALALQDRADTAPLIARIAGGNRYVIDYLASEVLDRLPDQLRRFLLQTAILGRMCGPLCDAVLGVQQADQPVSVGASGYSQLMLEQLERQHLFVVPLDDERRWYRYHYLFAAFLKARLLEGAAESQVAALHRRASAWFERSGYCEEAIQHALAGSDVERAAALIGQTGLRIASQGQVQTVLGWLHSLPEPQIRARSELCFLYAVLLLNTNQPTRAAEWLEQAERSMRSADRQNRQLALRGQLLVGRASLARIRGDLQRCVADAAQALELLQDAPPVFRAVALLNTAFAFLVSGDVTAASEQRVRQAIAATRDVGNPAAQLAGLVLLGVLQTLQGRRRQAALTYAQALALLPTQEYARTISGAAAAYLFYGEWLREQNRLAQAERLLEQGMGLVRDAGTVDAAVVLAGALAQMRLRLAMADQAGALEALDGLEHMLKERGAAEPLLAQVAAARAHVDLIAGRAMAAARWAASLPSEPSADSLFLRELEYLTLARVWLAQAGTAARLRQPALRLLSQLLAAAEASARADSAIRVRVLQALALQAAGATGEALAALAPALAAAAPAQYVRLFLDEGPPMVALLRAALARGIEAGYTAQLLAACSSAGTGLPPTAHAGLPEPLTARERGILRLIAGGASNQEVADTLIISVGTVKKHVNNIFGKLGVHSRTQAIARARELGLL